MSEDMKKNTPFIHLFKCSTGFYLYDVNSDLILKINEDTYRILESNGEIDDNKQIIKLKRAGYLKNKHVQISEHPMTPFLATFYKTQLNALTLQVTQNCNLRCEYCVYSGKYTTRTHSNKRMSYDMAKKGIDYLLAHSRESEELTLGFYGGEPLLEFPLIKKCVDYIEQKIPEKKIRYLITTNGTLLSKEIVEYMVKHNFDIIISLDGPREIHDKYRRFANDGQGTYNIIMEKIKYVKNTYKDFFKTNVKFNTVLNPREGYDCVSDYIRGDELLSDAGLTASIVSDIGLKGEEQELSNKFLEEYRYEYFKLLLSKVGKIQEYNISNVVQNEFARLLAMRGGKHQNGGRELPEKFHHGGPCIPGQRTVFLNVEGKFYPCEKVCEMANIAEIGDVWNGIDISKAGRILNIEKDTEEKCKQCWAYRYCNFCIRFAEPEEGSLEKNILQRCHGMQKTVEETFKDYCILRECGYDFEANTVKKQER